MGAKLQKFPYTPAIACNINYIVCNIYYSVCNIYPNYLTQHSKYTTDYKAYILFPANRHSATGCRLDTSLLSATQQGAECHSASKVTRQA